MKKLIILFISFFALLISWFSNEVNASVYTQENTKIKYCNDWDDCSLEKWIESTKGIKTIITDWLASDYIQKIVVYILWFLKLLAVLLIIYAWFNMLTSVWDEEKAKKSKTIIVFAILWLLIIFLAGPITNFILDILSQNP